MKLRARMFKKIINKRHIILKILLLALPAIVEMSLHTALGIADTLMISRMIGKDALSGVGFANSIIFPLIFVFTSFNIGATTLISQSYGRKDFITLNKIGSQTLLLNAIIGTVIMTLTVIFSNQIFSIYDVSPSVSQAIQAYFPIVAYSLPAMFLSFSFATILRGAGDTLSPMIITAIANIINIIGNYLLIKGVYCFPELGVKGAAISTSISRLIAALIYILICFAYHNKINLKLKYMKLQKNILKPLLQISIPGAGEEIIRQSSIIILSIIISIMNTETEAVYRILLNIESISFMVAVGISISAATLVGKSIGEDNIDKATEIGIISYSIAILWGIFLGICYFVFKRQFLGAFTTNDEVIKAGLFTMTLLAINQPLLNFIIVISGALRGAGDTKIVMIISAIRYLIIFVPFSYIFAINMNFGVAGIWMAEIISYSIFNPFLFRRFYSKKWAKFKFL